MNRRSLIPTVLSLPSSTTVWPTDLGSSSLAVTCLRSVTFLVVLELFFSSRLPWVVHSILVGLLLSLKFTDSPLEHAICHLFENGRCKPLCKPRLSRHTVFPTSTTLFMLGKVENLKRVFFSLSNRTFYLSNQKNRALFLDFVSSCLPPSWNTIRLKPRFHSNRKSELSKVSVMHVNNMFPTVSGQLISLYTMSNNGFYSKLYFTMNSLEHR